MKNEGLSDSVLLSTKLKMPAPRRDYVIRSELFSLLRRCAEVQIIYVKGAAGMGKTTLLSSYIKETGLKNTAWLTLDESNDNVFSFWHYFAAACQGFLGDDSERILSLIRSNFETAHIQSLLTLMINKLCGDEDCYLVLDDMHVIRDKALVDSVDYFIRSMPANMHLFMLSREDPALYLGEFAISGRLLFISGDQLRFSREESMRFLRQTLRMTASDETLSQMDEFAEGWIGGLQLVAAAGGAQKGLLSAAGNSIAADYLTREIYKRLTDDERRFLLLTGILPYFDREICGVLVADIDFEAMIERLTARNLFIICVDEENGVYRYHNILDEYLRYQFSRLPEAEQMKYRRAAAKALECRGDCTEALTQLYQIKDYEEAMRILKNMDETVETWAYIDRLPLSCLIGDINLATQCLMYNFGRINLERCGEVYRALLESESYQGFVGGLRYVFEMVVNNSEKVFTPQPISLEELDRYDLSPVTRSLLLFENANILLDCKRYDEARQFAEQALQAGGRENVFVHFYSLSTIAQIEEELGRLNESLVFYRQMEDFIRSSSMLDALGYNLYIGMIGVYHKRMEQGSAKKALDAAGEILKRSYVPPVIIQYGYDYHVAEHALLFGDAQQCVDIVTGIIDAYFSKNLMQLDRLLYGMEARGLLQPGVAEKFVAEVRAYGFDQASMTSQLLCARILWRGGETGQAGSIIENILVFSRATHNRLRIVEADLLKISLLLAGGDKNCRVIGNLLREAIYYAWENRIMVPFFLERETLTPIIEWYSNACSENLSEGERQFLAELLQLCAGQKPATDAQRLSTRELEVLGELAGGLTNPEIAEKLCISLATVKTHIINIYGKLGVSSRLSAAAEARKLNLI